MKNALLFLLCLSISAFATPIEDPTSVRLIDGRVVPFGQPGVICANTCTAEEAEFEKAGISKKWLLALPIAGAVIAGIAVSIKKDPQSLTTTNTFTPTPIDTITTSTTTIPAPVPEPGTFILVGLGGLFAWRRRKSSDV